jgi:DNA invertase Pin-like site-specific DNA recombinase
VIYVRISRDKRRGSLEQGLGVQAQEDLCRALAGRLGYTVVFVYVDNDISAYSGRPRPRYLKMLDALRAGKADVVLCWHTDRLHRSNAELEDYINVVEPREVKTETVTAGILDLNASA